jgi:hypothetical protein
MSASVPSVSELPVHQRSPRSLGNLSDNWAESFVKPAISGEFAVGRSQIYGKLSTVGERTFARAPSIVGEDASSFKIEDLSIGWRSGQSVGSSDNLLDFTVGRTQYKIGHGLLLWDGGGEGGAAAVSGATLARPGSSPPSDG